MSTPVTPVPRLALPNPHLRKPSLSSTVAQADSIRNSSIDVPVPAIPKEHQHKRSSSSDGAVGQAVSSYSPIDGPACSSSPSTASKKYTPPPPPPLPKSSRHNTASPKSKSNDSGYHSGGSTSEAKSPVVPMRSMFPVYNPQVPLAKQHYYPQRPVAARTTSPLSRLGRSEYPPSASAWTPIDRALGPPSAPPSVANFNLDALTPHLSSVKELDELWEATHGMEPNSKIRSYDLELAR